MEKDRKQKLGQAGGCLLCVLVLWLHLDNIGASEFSGGTVTGPIFSMADLGGDLFVLAVLAAFWFERVSAILALTSALLCLPLYLYFLAPGLFRWAFRGPWSVPIQTPFTWNTWAVAGILSLVSIVILSLRALRRPSGDGRATPLDSERTAHAKPNISS